MSHLMALMENEGTQNFMESNQEILAESEVAVDDFRKVMKSFVLQNSTEFLGSTLEETFKNIRAFSSVATAQFITEISSLVNETIGQTEAVVSESVNDYI